MWLDLRQHSHNSLGPPLVETSGLPWLFFTVMLQSVRRLAALNFEMFFTVRCSIQNTSDFSYPGFRVVFESFYSELCLVDLVYCNP